MDKYKAYLFDFDGTLVDSEKLKGSALAKTCNLFGGNVNMAIYKEVMGQSWEHVTSHFFTKAKIKPDKDEFNASFKEIYQELLRNELHPNLNVRNLLHRLRKKEKRMGVVSSASFWMVDQVLVQLGLYGFFEIVITKEDVVHHKPDPEAYLLALKKMSLMGSEVLIFEDSKAGLIAANRAECDAVAFKHDFNVNQDLSLAIRTISDYKKIL